MKTGLVVAKCEPAQVGAVWRGPVRDPFCNLVEDVALLVLREATHREWEESVRERGGDPSGFPVLPHYYEVLTD